MARAVYAIISHTNPDQVVRLVATIARGSPRAAIVVHHDQAHSFLDPRRFDAFRNVYLVPSRRYIRWGDFSLVQVTLELMAWAVETVDFDWFVLLSGQDYPIQPLERIEDALRGGGVQGYISGVPFDQGAPCGPTECVVQRPGKPCEECVSGYHYRYFALPRIPGAGRLTILANSLQVDRWLNAHQSYVRVRRSFQERLSLLLGFRVRGPFSPALKPYKGSQWISLHREAVRYVLDFVQRNPAYVYHYQRTIIPDESFFQTILLNQSRLRLSRNNMRFVSWPSPWSPHPDVLVTADLNRLLESGCHFARRFDVTVDSAVLDSLDEVLALGPAPTGHRRGSWMS